MLTLFHNAIDRGEHEKYLGNTENPLVAAHAPGSISHSEKAKGQLRFVFSIL